MVKTRTSYFVSAESQPRVRRTSDAVTAITGLLLVAWGVYSIERDTPVEETLDEFLTDLPTWVTSLAQLVFVLGLLYGLGILIAMVVGGRPRRAALRDLVVATIGATVLATALGLIFVGEWPYVLPELGLEDPDPRFPVLRVVVVVAVLVAASPHLAKPMRRLGWTTIVLMGLAAVTLSYGSSSDAVGSIGTGMLVAGLVLVVVGSPRGYPDPASVAESLSGMGLDVNDVRIDTRQTWGFRRLVGTAADGSGVAIKAYGRDATDTMRMAKAWRTLWYREGGRAVSLSRLQAVEHEALVTMMAERSGVAVSGVIAAGETSSEVALLVQRGGGTRLSDLDVGEIRDELVVQIWQDVARLHDASISHGSLTTDAILSDGRGHVIGDFSLGSVVATEAERSDDIVELLVSLSPLIGAERSVVSAVQGLGSDAVSAALPYLQLPGVSRGTRQKVDDPKATIEELKTAVSDVAGLELPDPVKIRRVSIRDLLTAALLLLAVGALVPMIAGIDFAEVWSVLQNASWGLMLVALVVGQTMFIPDAMGMMFAVGGGLPFWPLVTLQVAIKFIGVAIPSVAGRVAMNAAFLHKFGVGVAAATTQGAIDSLSGFVVEVSILILALLYAVLYGDFGASFDVETEDVPWAVVLLIAVVLALVTVAAFRWIKRLRELVFPVIREGWQALVAVVKDPVRALGLLGSNLGTRMVMAAALWLVLQGIHTPLGYLECLVAVVATNLLQGVVPVPGGIGVTETLMTAILVFFGVDENAAFAAAISWRVITFYLPAAEGFFAMRWLEKHQYL